jgi:hypothetical protein
MRINLGYSRLMAKAILRIAFAISLLASLPACSATDQGLGWRSISSSNWLPADLQLLRLPTGITADQSMVALYLRSIGSDLQIRIDLLDLPKPFNLDLYLALDTQPGGTDRLPFGGTSSLAWERLLVLPAHGQPYTLSPELQPDADLIPRVVIDPDNAFLTVHINRDSLPGNPERLRFEAWLVSPGSSSIVDAAGPVDPTSPAPATAPLLLEFWDTLPALTPAQALRRWDGAHTGPFGGRHGLHELLDAAEAFAVPITLLDLKTPASLSAVDYMGGTRQVRRMAGLNLLTLPDATYGDPHTGDVSLGFSRQAGDSFAVGQSLFLYGDPGGSASAQYPFRFASLADATHVLTSGSQRLIPLPPARKDATAAGNLELLTEPPGLPVELRKELLRTALSRDPADLVVLGGSLPASAWGDSRAAQSAFAYIAAHPWIHVLDSNDLAIFPTVQTSSQAAPLCPLADCLPDPAFIPDPHYLEDPVAADLRTAPTGLPRDLAWQSYLMLTGATTDSRLQSLRLGYLPQVRDLIAVSRWAANPQPVSRCDWDIDGDELAECLLASDRLFLILRPDGARLLFAFAQIGGQTVELAGPASQFAVGLGDPSGWQPALGLFGDPNDVPGGFAEIGHERDAFQPYARPAEIVFTDPVRGITRTFRLDGLQIQITQKGLSTGDLRLPLAIAPQARFTSGWSSLIDKEPGSARAVTLGMRGTATVQVSSDNDFQASSYFASIRAIGTIENPDEDYPPGHYVPFPLSVLTFHPTETRRVVIDVHP